MTQSTDQETDPMTSPTPETAPDAVPQRPSLLRVLRDQRKTVTLALLLVVATYWIAGQLGEWRLAACIAAGIGLGLVNHLVTEFWLLKLISSGEEPTRSKIAVSTFIRLAALSVVAVAIAVMFWPDGIGLLLGLAIFRLIALVMTGIPLLKELNKA
ncbi:MAG: ATP synthase subunit I [Oryzihumus sp.]